GDVLRIRNDGIKHLDGGRGDQLVRIVVITPTRVSNRERELYRELQKALSDPLPGPRKVR
ncbi:MAG: molecular chaperone DnaJ, partial [candidate division WOR-3 bacterium]